MKKLAQSLIDIFYRSKYFLFNLKQIITIKSQYETNYQSSTLTSREKKAVKKGLKPSQDF